MAFGHRITKRVDLGKDTCNRVMKAHPYRSVVLLVIIWMNRVVRSFPVVSERFFSLSTVRFATTLDTISNDGSNARSGKESSQFPRVLLKRNRQSRSFRDGSQLVFTGSIAQVVGSLQVADFVQVEVPVSDDKKNKNTQLVGWGVYNPESMYRVRILCHFLLNPELTKLLKTSSSEDSDSVLAKILNMQFQKAYQTRQALGLPSPTTDTYRLINGEGDVVSGLAVDIVGGKTAVVMSSAAWCEVQKPIILECLQNILPDHDLIWKTTPSRLRQDGFDVDGEGDDSEVVDAAPVICLENGIKYRTFPHQQGQKTSVYCDQRENRWNLAQLCKGKRVLDLCCYHGGFSLNAAMNEASSVVGVDSSQDAIDTCNSNAELNGLQNNVEFIRSDIANFMQNCDSSNKFDVVVLDPPKLAPSLSTLNKATRKYHSLNRDALKLIDDDNGGLFMTCTCSAAMTQKDGGTYFLQMVQQAAISAKREISLLRVSGAAPCHTQSPVSFPAGNYLTAALFIVHPKS